MKIQIVYNKNNNIILYKPETETYKNKIRIKFCLFKII